MAARLRPRSTPDRVTASSPADYTLPAVDGRPAPLARAWLWLGLAALIGSGLFSVLLVLARTPGVNAWLPAGDFFRVALVVHVDLSVLVWFVAIAGLLWSLNLRGARTRRGAAIGRLTLALCGLGALGMALAAFVDPGTPVMANYIPMLDSATFRAAVVVFGAGALLLVLRSLVQARPVGPAVDGAGALRFGLHASVVATAVALLAFAWSLALVPTELPPKAYYEILFWGGGHALQFTWTLLMLVAWLALAQACGGRVPLSPRVVLLLFALALASVFVTPLAYLMHDVSTRRAPRHAHLGHALRRRPGHRAGGAGGAAGAGAAAATGRGPAAAARGAAGVDAAVRGRRRDRPHDPAAATSRSRRTTTAASSA